MADKKYVEEKAKEYKKNARKNFLTANAILLGAATTLALGFKKGVSVKGDNFIKKNAKCFDYKKGIYMSRGILAGITLFGDIPNTLLASRDKEELKYNCIRNAVFFATFFGGDLALNNISARILSKTCKDVHLVNNEKLSPKASVWKKLTAPLYSMKELEQKKDWDPKILKKTKRFKVGMFWADFAAITAFLGFGTPFVLNKMVKKSVEKDVNSKKSALA
jgi:hypothetical protein